MVCGLCGSRYIGGRVTDGKGWQKYYYRCGRQVHTDSPDCKGMAIPADFVDTYVWDQCVKFIENPGEVIHLLQARIAEYLDTTKDTAEQVDQLQRTLLEKGKARDRIKELFIQGHITPDEMGSRFKAVDQEISVLRKEIDDQRSQSSLGNVYAEYYENVTNLLHSLRKVVTNIDATTKQYVVSKLVASVRVNTVFEPKKSANLEYHFHFKTEHVGLDSCSGQTARECTDGPPGHRAIPYPWP
jgi:site-specific DNA recombinase